MFLYLLYIHDVCNGDREKDISIRAKIQYHNFLLPSTVGKH